MNTSKIITIATMKGGTGKTTLVFNLACMLASQYKVLAIDLDQQCNLSSNFGYDIFDESQPSVADMFEDLKTDPLDVVLLRPIEAIANLDLVPSTMYLQGTELTLANAIARETIFLKYMENHQDFFNHYDYIIFDTAPNFGICTQNSLFASDHILLVTDPDCNSARGADLFLYYWNKCRMYTDQPDKVSGLIINNVERTRITAQTIEYITSHPVLSKLVMNTTIPHTTRFKECGLQNLPIHMLETKTGQEEKSRQKAEKAMLELITELKERGVI